jgi:hypothetical protein
MVVEPTLSIPPPPSWDSLLVGVLPERVLRGSVSTPAW